MITEEEISILLNSQNIDFVDSDMIDFEIGNENRGVGKHVSLTEDTTFPDHKRGKLLILPTTVHILFFNSTPLHKDFYTDVNKAPFLTNSTQNVNSVNNTKPNVNKNEPTNVNINNTKKTHNNPHLWC